MQLGRNDINCFSTLTFVSIKNDIICCSKIDYLFSKVIDELGSALCSGNQHDLVTKISALELMLKQQVPLIAISLDDFVQLNSAIKVFHAD